MTTEFQLRKPLSMLSGADQVEQALELLVERLAHYPQRVRTAVHINREYNHDKYGTLLEAGPKDFAEVTAILNSGLPAGDDLVVYRGELCVGRQQQLQSLMWHWIDRVLELRFAAAHADWICELGCGVGGHLVRSGLPSYGGELTVNGVRLAQSFGLDVSAFDFYDLSSYNILRPRSVVFTCHAIEQLPSAKAFLEHIRAHRDKISAVVHFEPLALGRTSARGRLQERYLELNDYNRDLYELLSASCDIELLRTDVDLVGGNPLNPASLVEWRFRSC